MYVWWPNYVRDKSPFLSSDIVQLTERETHGSQMIIITPMELLFSLKKSPNFMFARKFRSDLPGHIVEAENKTRSVPLAVAVDHYRFYDWSDGLPSTTEFLFKLWAIWYLVRYLCSQIKDVASPCKKIVIGILFVNLLSCDHILYAFCLLWLWKKYRHVSVQQQCTPQSKIYWLYLFCTCDTKQNHMRVGFVFVLFFCAKSKLFLCVAAACTIFAQLTKSCGSRIHVDVISMHGCTMLGLRTKHAAIHILNLKIWREFPQLLCRHSAELAAAT